LKITIKDVAREAGVSIATVSRVLNGNTNVSDQTKKKVIKAIRKLGYKPARFNKPLIGSRFNIIGVLVPDIFAYHYSDIVEGAVEYLREKGYEVFVYMFHRKLETELHAIDYFFMSKVDGVIVCTSKEDDTYLKILEETAIPVVTVDREIGDFRFDAVNIDNYKAGKVVAEYLFKKGHRKVLHITGDLKIFSVNNRMKGFASKAKKLGMDVEVLEGSFEVGMAYKLMKERLKRKVDFTAVFASADMLAVEVIKALNDSGLSVPEDVSVMGFDDAYFSKYTVPSLTTVRQPRMEMGLSAAQLLLSRIKGRHGVNRKIVLPVEVIERDSVREI
jgi:LacI family transcriptional regulator